MCSRAPEALNTCCAGPFPLPVLIACAGLHPAEHPWSSVARYPALPWGLPACASPTALPVAGPPRSPEGPCGSHTAAVLSPTGQ